MTEPSLRKQLDRIVCADGVEDELVEIFTTAWDAERKNIGRGIAPKGTKTRAGLHAVYEALLDKISALDLTPSQQATVQQFGLDYPPLPSVCGARAPIRLWIRRDDDTLYVPTCERDVNHTDDEATTTHESIAGNCRW